MSVLEASTTRRERDPGAYVFLALMVLIGSSTATAAKFAVRELPIGLLPVVRFGVAGLCLLPLVLRSGRWVRMVREDRGRLLLAGALCVPVNQSFFLSGTRLAPTTHVGLIYAMCPLIVLGLTVALGQEQFRPSRLAGILTTVAGAIIIAASNLWQGRAGGAPTAIWGDLLLVGAVASWAGYLTVNKPLVARHGALTVLVGTFLVGSVLAMPLAAYSLATAPPLGHVSTNAWLGLAYLALIVTVIGLACQNQALRRLEASEVATVGNAAPVLTILWGVWLLGEAVTPGLVLGGALVLGGIVWGERSAR